MGDKTLTQTPYDTGNKTVSGRIIWNDPKTGEDYSERSTTFEINGEWYTMPTVSEDGNQYTEDQLRDYVIEYGPIDYLTGEELPKFKSKKDAIGYAINRSNTRKETGEAYGYFKGGAASLKDQTESAFDLNKDKTEVQEELVAPITVSDLDSRPLSLLDARDDDRYLGEFDG
jgi:hypothetical protein